MEEEIRDNSQRSKDILMIFMVALGMNVILILLTIYQSYLLNSFTNKPGELETIEFLDIVIPVAYYIRLTVYIVTIIFFLRWFKRAYGNLIRRHQPTDYSENGSVWGFFIPLINLFRPYTTAKEIFLKTQYAIKEYNSSFKVDTDSSFIALWWIIYLGNGFFENFAMRNQEAARDIPSFVSANGYVIISKAVAIISVLCVMYMIRKISRLEAQLQETGASVSEIDNIGKAIE